VIEKIIISGTIYFLLQRVTPEQADRIEISQAMRDGGFNLVYLQRQRGGILFEAREFKDNTYSDPISYP
jgi:hypothetical protein